MKRNMITALLLLVITVGALLLPLLPLEKLPIPGLQGPLMKLRYNMNRHEYTDGLGEVTALQAYQGNVLLANPEAADFRYDVKKVYETENFTRVVDFPNGFYVDLPGKITHDFSRGEGGVKVYGDGYEALFTREGSPYEDTLKYIDEYINKYVANPAYQQANNITLHEDTVRTVKDAPVRILSMTRTPAEGSDVKLNSYTIAYILDPNGGQIYHRMLLKAETYEPETVNNILNSLTVFDPIGYNMTTIPTKAELPRWNEETAAFYESLVSRDDVLWGVYNHKLITVEGMAPTMEELEAKLDYNFELCMGYTYLMEEPPVKGLQEAYDDGKITEMTLQVCTIDHMALDSSTNPNFEVIDGLWDDQIRKYARAFKEFSHPILFRVNNEMNTDWCTYSGVVTLQDPDIYKMVYSRIYNIFQEEGVDNVIWIFNPQYGNYPPASFNHHMNYYPGNDKVQMLGVTKYNTGTYYNEVFGETWTDFKPAFDALNTLYSQDFSEVPWIVTEFASSSYGGDKVQWMQDMFTHIGDYQNIKAAVWFNSGDRDYREGMQDIIARPYYLDETPETLDMFQRGVKGEFSKK
ncbi:MAG: hypothetical protein IKW04_00230 [Clostridia bacterium]|nr:hypothetical protein [Clostridia bacterium]